MVVLQCFYVLKKCQLLGRTSLVFFFSLCLEVAIQIYFTEPIHMIDHFLAYSVFKGTFSPLALKSHNSVSADIAAARIGSMDVLLVQSQLAPCLECVALAVLKFLIIFE